MPKAKNAKRFIDRVCLAAILALAAGSALQAAEPAQPPAAAAPAAPAAAPSAAPEPAPGIAPGVVPGATPGAGMGGGAPGAPAEAAAPSPGEDTATQVSPAEVIGSPDWPCQQRKVMTITAAQIWDGPSIENLKVEKDETISDLTEVLASRRVSLEDAEKAIKEFAAAQPEADRDRKLTLLFASVLDKTNTDRQFVLGRVEEFQRHQKGRATELEHEGQKLAEKKLSAADQLVPTETLLTPQQQEYNWNARIFQDRQQNLTLACEIPGLIEQRAYEIARLIRAQMKS